MTGYRILFLFLSTVPQVVAIALGIGMNIHPVHLVATVAITVTLFYFLIAYFKKKHAVYERIQSELRASLSELRRWITEHPEKIMTSTTEGHQLLCTLVRTCTEMEEIHKDGGWETSARLYKRAIKDQLTAGELETILTNIKST